MKLVKCFRYLIHQQLWINIIKTNGFFFKVFPFFRPKFRSVSPFFYNSGVWKPLSDNHFVRQPLFLCLKLSRITVFFEQKMSNYLSNNGIDTPSSAKHSWEKKYTHPSYPHLSRRDPSVSLQPLSSFILHIWLLWTILHYGLPTRLFFNPKCKKWGENKKP